MAVRALDYALTIMLAHFRSPPSSLYTFPLLQGLARRCLATGAGGSPNLTGFTQALSLPGAQFLSLLCLPISPSRHRNRVGHFNTLPGQIKYCDAL